MPKVSFRMASAYREWVFGVTDQHGAENSSVRPHRGPAPAHIGKDDYERERAAIEAELAQLQGQPAVPSVRQFSARITDLVAAWEDATPDQRSRLASSILLEIQVKTGPSSRSGLDPVGLPTSRSCFGALRSWSGRRVSNSRPQRWQRCALPTELLPRCDTHYSQR